MVKAFHRLDYMLAHRNITRLRVNKEISDLVLLVDELRVAYCKQTKQDIVFADNLSMFPIRLE